MPIRPGFATTAQVLVLLGDGIGGLVAANPRARSSSPTRWTASNGDLVIDIAEMPVKCPVVPHEFACHVDEYLARRCIRGKTELTPVTTLMRKPAHVIAETGNSIIESGVLMTDASDRDQG